MIFNMWADNERIEGLVLFTTFLEELAHLRNNTGTVILEADNFPHSK